MSIQPLVKQVRDAMSACEQFEADLSALVDGELSSLDASRVAVHVDSCNGCHSFVQGLTDMGKWHQEMRFELSDGVEQEDHAAESVVAKMGAAPIWQGLVKRLMADTSDRLSDVLYELGKALIAAGHDTSSRITQINIFQKRPRSIPSLNKKGRQLAREYGDLRVRAQQDSATDVSERDGRRNDLSRRDLRGGGLFPSNDQSLQGSAAFEAGRRCLEQALKLNPECHNARIFLSDYHKTMGRLDRARQELRILMRSDADARTKMIARHHMSRVYSMARQFARAMELEKLVLEEATESDDRLFQAIALTNLTIYSAKLDRLDETEASLARLVKEFPSQLASVAVPAFRRAQDFKRALAKNTQFLNGLRQRYPAIFCS